MGGGPKNWWCLWGKEEAVSCDERCWPMANAHEFGTEGGYSVVFAGRGLGPKVGPWYNLVPFLAWFGMLHGFVTVAALLLMVVLGLGKKWSEGGRMLGIR